MSSERVTMIESRLSAAFNPTELQIQDDSAKHAGHAGARSGGGHFNVYIVSPAFASKNLLERHRMIYEALGDAMQTDIHALSIQAKTPEEI